MKILVTGARGMLGTDLCALLPQQHEVIAVDLPEMDITDTTGTMAMIDLHRPEMVIHCAAYTDVDGCEREPDRAYRVNAFGTWNVAAACHKYDIKLVYISTDFVFDGEKGAPYDEFDRPNPIGVYGRSKYVGEELVRQLVAKHIIIRTSWLFGLNGRNFVCSIHLGGMVRDELQVVADQVGCPTYTVDLAEAIAGLAGTELYGTYHITNAGACSWAQFAEEIVRQAGSKAKVIPIPSLEWNSPTRRPKDSRLRHLALEMQGRDNIRPWQEALAEFLKKFGVER